MTLDRRTLLARLGLATSGAVALAGCAGDSGTGGSDATDSGPDGTTAEDTTGGDADTNGAASDGTGTNETGADGSETTSTTSTESQVTNELQGAVELVSKKRYVENGTLYVQASVEVTDAEAIDGYLALRSKVRTNTLTVGNDIAIVREYETDQSYDLTAKFPDVDPEKVDSYTITLKALSNEQPNNG